MYNPGAYCEIQFGLVSSLTNRCLTGLLVEVEPSCFQVACCGNFASDLETHQKVLVSQECALIELEIH